MNNLKQTGTLNVEKLIKLIGQAERSKLVEKIAVDLDMHIGSSLNSFISKYNRGIKCGLDIKIIYALSHGLEVKIEDLIHTINEIRKSSV